MMKKEKIQKNSSMSRKLFWLTLAVILVVVPLMGLIGSNFSNLVGKAVGDKAVQRIDIVQPGSKFFMEIRDIEGLYLLTLEFSKSGKNIVIEIEEVGSINWNFDGNIYTTFRAVPEDADKINSAEFTFKIDEQKLYQHGIGKKDLRLYINGQELETVFDRQEGKYFFYKATTNEWGDFVLGRIKAAPAAEETIESGSPAESPEATASGQLPLVGKAAGQETESEGFFSKIIDFFKNLFS